MSAKGGFVYILTNKNITLFYTGVTSDIRNRIYQHKYEHGSIFTKRYNLHFLMYFQFYESIDEAISEEKRLKKWRTNWKIELIKKANPYMVDLAKDWYNEERVWLTKN